MTESSYVTCLASPRNAHELLVEAGASKLLGLLAFIVASADPKETPVGDRRFAIAEHIMHTLSGIATMVCVRAHAVSRVPSVGVIGVFLVLCSTAHGLFRLVFVEYVDHHHVIAPGHVIVPRRRRVARRCARARRMLSRMPSYAYPNTGAC